MAYSRRGTFQSRLIVHDYFTHAMVLSITHMWDIKQLLGNAHVPVHYGQPQPFTFPSQVSNVWATQWFEKVDRGTM